MKLQIQAASDVGCIRENNEDMILVAHRFVRDDELTTVIDTGDGQRCLVALADGMGGHSGGEVASSDVLHNLDFYFSDLPQGLDVTDFHEAIYEWLASINNIIDSKGHADKRYYQMGTTLVAMACYGGQYYWMNCGDSRLYAFRDGHLRQLSTDHSLSNLMGSSQHSSLITNCIGGGCKTSFIDLVTCTPDVQPGTTFLLCSDGLTDMVDDTTLTALLSAGAGARELVATALAAGGYDNVSVCLITVA